jgi:hypothetical protein
MPTLTALTATGGAGTMKGVLIDDNPSRIYLGIDTNTIITGNITFNASPTNTPAEYILSGLTASQQYTFSKVGAAHTLTAVGSGGTHNVDSKGLLRFTN